MESAVETFKRKAVSSKAQRNTVTETVILRCFLFFAVPGWDFRNAGTFSQDLFTHNTTCTYLSLFKGYWNFPVQGCSLFKGCWNLNVSKKVWIQKYFGPVTVDSVKIFGHFAFWRHGSRLASCFICTKELLFLRRIF